MIELDNENVKHRSNKTRGRLLWTPPNNKTLNPDLDCVT